ncbi:class I SAM-dependent methyltransferase [Emergencia timonensis]|uniref:Class I SAM-dependent methyltransferase n=1 Tax=Emergencia timonensis TaxID=1776384 RepID=A0A415E4A2_9FIRM|nr:class I SAM-dependent methyltransferase [Emergencia timonensis]
MKFSLGYYEKYEVVGSLGYSEIEIEVKKLRAIHHAVLNEISCSSTIPQTILDVGCGNGVFTQEVSATFPRSDITAIDISIPKSFSPGNITFLKGSAEQLPFVSESFDLVITVLSLHHWKEKNKGISEIYRVLKKGGRIIIGDPLLEDWMSNRILGLLMQKLDGGTFTDKKRVSGYLNTAGFEDISIGLIPNTMKSLYLITAKKSYNFQVIGQNNISSKNHK